MRNAADYFPVLEERVQNLVNQLSSHYDELTTEQEVLERKLSSALDEIDREYDDIIKRFLI